MLILSNVNAASQLGEIYSWESAKLNWLYLNLVCELNCCWNLLIHHMGDEAASLVLYVSVVFSHSTIQTLENGLLL